ncbi:ribbon-helix-helix domain-containing protein [Minwuia sp.]|uniref:ribbon-helix-helix domain-containing protein n=1 Tax=Minwuia sp. TaxID=2493630 RepID=UPI003A92F384
MTKHEKITVELPEELASEVRRLVADGSFENESAALQQGIQHLLDHEAGVDDWLRREVLAGHSEYTSDPRSAVDGDRLLHAVREEAANLKRKRA